MNLTPGMVHNFPKVYRISVPYAQKDPRFLFKKRKGQPSNSGLSSQKMVEHYPRTVWENSYAEHEVTGKTYNLKRTTKKHQRTNPNLSRTLNLQLSMTLKVNQT